MSPRLRIQVALYTLSQFIITTGYRMVYPFLAVFARGLGLDLSAISLAVTARSVTGAIGPFLASIADSRGRKAGMLAGLGIYALGVALVVIWPVYPVFFLSLILATLGNSVYRPSMQASLGDTVPYERRGFAMAIVETSWSLSFIIGIPLIGFLISRYGWIAPFPLLGLLGLLAMSFMAWRLPRDPHRTEQPPSLWHNFRSVLTYGPALACLAMSAMLTTSNEVINLMFGVWMEDSFGLKIAALGIASAIIGFSELGGESLSGFLVDRLGKERSIQAGILLNCLAAATFPLFGQHLWSALISLALFYLTYEFTLVSTLPLISEVLPSARATLLAANVATLSLGRALGATLATPLYHSGILASAIAAILANLVAFWLLTRIRVGKVVVKATP